MDGTELRDIKPLEDVPLGKPWGLYAAGLGLLLVVLIVGLWLWRRRARFVRATPLLPPDAVALRELEAVRGLAAGSLDERRKLHFRASVVLRDYVEARFGLNATDLTTEELVALLRERPVVPRDELVALLVAADAVKFAQGAPTGEDCEAWLARARRFVEATRPVMEPAA